MDSNEFKELLTKYSSGQCTPTERALVEKWYTSLNEQKTRKIISEQDLSAAQVRLRKRLSLVALERNSKPLLVYYAAAAALFLAVSISLIIYTGQQKVNSVSIAKTRISPGTNKAVLTMADGHEIYLSDAPNGQLAHDANTIVLKQQGGEVRFDGIDNGQNESSTNSTNVITVPRGGQWKVILADGTAAWLNASTTLTFPANFTGSKREIYLDGEAYFEVAKDKQHPFLVHSGKQTIEVLGTHFNVNAYPDEPVMKTTLLEGAVKLNGDAVLRPGDQASYNGAAVNIKEVDTEQAVAWQQGNIIFGGQDLASIMRVISRWYNVETSFQSEDLKLITFSGSIPRSVSIKTLLHRLALTKEVRFQIDGRHITVQPNTSR